MNKIFILLIVFSSSLYADSYVTCESEGYKHRICPIQNHGYVRIKHQISKTSCIKGQTWDYDRRSVWVDDGCAAEFVVESRSHSSHIKGKDVAVAALGLALLASANKNNQQSHNHNDSYNDNNYHGSRHSSYIPDWMTGVFLGYNSRFGAEVKLRIDKDGRAVTHVNGNKLTGYVNDKTLHIGDHEFYINKTRGGFNTTQVGHNRNVVHYSRK